MNTPGPVDPPPGAARLCARGDDGWWAVVASNEHSAMSMCGVGINFPDYDHREPDCPDCMAALRRLHRCVDHLDHIGGWPPYECVVCGKRLSHLDIEEAGQP